jgi:hypothetical protein
MTMEEGGGVHHKDHRITGITTKARGVKGRERERGREGTGEEWRRGESGKTTAAFVVLSMRRRGEERKTNKTTHKTVRGVTWG